LARRRLVATPAALLRRRIIAAVTVAEHGELDLGQLGFVGGISR
jgi:hypothetical protein